MEKQYILLWLLFVFVLEGNAQQIKGTVYEDGAEDALPLIGAHVHWSGTELGTVTDIDGQFIIDRHPTENSLVVSYIGYESDTVFAANNEVLRIGLKKSVDISEVDVVRRVKTTTISTLTPRKLEHIGEAELQKAACCNLSESFETSPSIDVSFTDAVTGTRQIQMLGLAGPYTQFTRENIPTIRGVSSIYGLTFVPGTWVESIQLNKGAGSVLNGYESIAGQINYELRKPEDSERLYVNAYANSGGRAESNVHVAHRLNPKWSTGVLVHGMANTLANDHNNDGFLDMPMGQSFVGMNRWKYTGTKGIRFQAGIKGTYVSKMGGQKGFDPDIHKQGTELWGMGQDIRQADGWIKIAKILSAPQTSTALQISGTSHTLDSYYGQRAYIADENDFYANYIYQGIMGNTMHSYKTGASFRYDRVIEQFGAVDFAREEYVPGVYFEYTYNSFNRFSAVAGLRADNSSIYGAFVTPRLHLRYAPFEKLVFRASAGRGTRTAHIISENSGLLASSRRFNITAANTDKPYGLDAERAWNFGLNLTKKFRLDYRDGSIGADLYYTYFENQIVTDLYADPQVVNFYNLDGTSYSTSFQLQFDYELVRRLDVRLAYRWYDVRTTYAGQLRDKPLLAQHRAFANFAYSSRKHWKFDYTVNWFGEKTLPNTSSNPEQYQLGTHSPAFVVMNAQTSKRFGERFECYAGVENILNFTQPDPIVASEDPFSDYFDGSMIWGPIFGRKFYAGLRLKFK